MASTKRTHSERDPGETSADKCDPRTNTSSSKVPKTEDTFEPGETIEDKCDPRTTTSPSDEPKTEDTFEPGETIEDKFDPRTTTTSSDEPKTEDTFEPGEMIEDKCDPCTSTSSSGVSLTEDTYKNYFEQNCNEVMKDNMYRMDNTYRGVALIFNHKVFEGETEKERTGTECDKNVAEETLHALGFNVTSFDDLSRKDIERCLKKASEMDHSENDCILIVVLTHGDKNGRLYAKDLPYFRQDLYKPFLGDNCPSLLNKPKIFIIQACWGGRDMRGVPFVQKDNIDHYPIYRHPTHADLFIYSASFEGFASYRNPTIGCYFIQGLMLALEKYAFDVDLLTIVLFHQRMMQNKDIKSLRPNKEQVPVLLLTCGKKIQFNPKPLPHPYPKRLQLELKQCIEEIDLAGPMSKIQKKAFLEDIKDCGVVKLRNVPADAWEHVKYAEDSVQHLELTKATYQQLCSVARMPYLTYLKARTPLILTRNKNRRSEETADEREGSEVESSEQDGSGSSSLDSTEQLPDLDSQLQHLEAELGLETLRWLLMGSKKTLKILRLWVGTPAGPTTTTTKARKVEWPRSCENLDTILKDCMLRRLEKLDLLREKQGLLHDIDQCEKQIADIKKVFTDRVIVECTACRSRRKSTRSTNNSIPRGSRGRRRSGRSPRNRGAARATATPGPSGFPAGEPEHVPR